MSRSALLACALAGALASTAMGGAPAAAETAVWDATPQQAYVSAVGLMRSLPNPPFATYRSSWRSSGLGFDFEEDDGKIVIDVGFGNSFVHEREYDAAYRAADRQMQLSDADGRRLVGTGRLLEPTFAGAYDILRYGLRGSDVATEASPEPEAPPPALATAEPEPAASIADIATVTAISPLFYRIADEGTRPCSGLGDGRGLHLVARTSIREHPLTDVVLDPASGRFCSMTFVIKESGLAGVTGHYTINFSPFGAYWLVSNGTIDVNVRLLGISAKHARLEWTIADVATPDNPPGGAFESPSPPPPPPGSAAPGRRRR